MPPLLTHWSPLETGNLDTALMYLGLTKYVIMLTKTYKYVNKTYEYVLLSVSKVNVFS